MSRALAVAALALAVLVLGVACVLSDGPCPPNNMNPLRFALISSGADASGNASAQYAPCPVAPPVTSQALGGEAVCPTSSTDAPCTMCMETECCAAGLACLYDALCIHLAECWNSDGGTPAACSEEWGPADPAFTTYSACAAHACAAQCPRLVP
jgi:hypothetical protein